MYNITGKVLAGRIQKVISSIITNIEAGLILGGKVSDNIIVVHELIKAYTRQ